MKTLKQLYWISFLLILSACAPKAVVSTYWVNSVRGDCTGVAPMKCLLVQQGENIDPSAWEHFYGTIEGFEFHMGYLYKIRVKEVQLAHEDIPADGSSLKYSLVKIISQEADLKLALNNPWEVTSLFGNKLKDLEKTANKVFRLNIALKESRITGTDGCNHFNGSITTVGQNGLKFGPIASTRRMCTDMTLARKFSQALAKVEKYEIKEMTLYLYCEEGNEVMTLKKDE